MWALVCSGLEKFRIHFDPEGQGYKHGCIRIRFKLSCWIRVQGVIITLHLFYFKFFMPYIWAMVLVLYCLLILFSWGSFIL